MSQVSTLTKEQINIIVADPKKASLEDCKSAAKQTGSGYNTNIIEAEIAAKETTLRTDAIKLFAESLGWKEYSVAQSEHTIVLRRVK